ncbi:MAG: hypothetical protein RML56_14100 [Burkholderiales bacterium]|nr:hypothetical protein [Burkholderiales bacterium]
MSAGLRHRFQHERAQLVGELAQLPAIEAAQVRRVVHRLEQLVHGRIVVPAGGAALSPAALLRTPAAR